MIELARDDNIDNRCLPQVSSNLSPLLAASRGAGAQDLSLGFGFVLAENVV
jgi:hypothetical protein